MRIGTFQFQANNDLDSNLEGFLRCLRLAQSSHIDLVLTQECGLTGYPPIEVPSIQFIDQKKVKQYLWILENEVKNAGVALGVGAAYEEQGSCRNSIFFFFPDRTDIVHYDKRALWGWDIPESQRR